eukprot:2605383-Rhodomonas_salina.1
MRLHTTLLLPPFFSSFPPPIFPPQPLAHFFCRPLSPCAGLIVPRLLPFRKQTEQHCSTVWRCAVCLCLLSCWASPRPFRGADIGCVRVRVRVRVRVLPGGCHRCALHPPLELAVLVMEAVAPAFLDANDRVGSSMSMCY